MASLHARDLVPFPLDGANSSETVINGQSYNLTTLRTYNFSLYTNGTISNDSWCYLTLPGISNMPQIYPNGSIVNGTSCYFPYWGIQQRGGIGLAFGVLYAMSIMLTLVCLHKHGKLFLPQEKRFRAIGRRWQWYWMLFVAACGTIGSISSIDVDRGYLQSTGIVIQTFFWYLMVPGLLATVWEGVRHWGSWQERQAYDREPFSLPHTDRRSKVEFYLPLLFYLFAWLNFFMNIPRNWQPFQAQSDSWQTVAIAQPTALDTRFKAGAILAFIAWLLIIVSLWHSIRHYRPWHGRAMRKTWSCIRSIPVHFLFTIPLLLLCIGYAEAQGWLWSINVGNSQADRGFLYGLGSGPAVLILYINIIAGLRAENEDLQLIQQRGQRGAAIDAELGLDRRARKPWWWRRTANELGLSNDAKLRQIAMANEVGGGRATSDRISRQIELGVMPVRSADEFAAPLREHAQDMGVSTSRDEPGRDEEEGRGRGTGLLDVGARPGVLREDSGSALSARTTVSQAEAQRVRSMLDI